MTETTSTGRYRVTRHPGGKITIHAVPIFAECFRAPRRKPDGTMPEFDGNFDAAWIREAVRNAKQRHAEGYFMPMHIRHHEKTAMGDEARPAGTFRVIGTTVIRYEGKPRLAVLADLIVSDPTAQNDVLEERVPFRSIETLHPGTKPEFDSLALLDHEVPFLRLPNMTIGEVDDQTGAVPIGTFSEPWEMGALEGCGPMVAFRADGDSTALLFRDDGSSMKAKTEFGAGVAFADHGDEKDRDKKAGTDKKVDLQDGEGGGEGEGEGEMDPMGDISDMLKRVASGELSFKNMMALREAIDQAMASVVPDEPAEEELAPAAVPGGDAMKADRGSMTQEFAELKADYFIERKLNRKLRHTSARDRAVAAAEKRLEGRLLGDIHGDLVEFYDDHPDAFGSFVDRLCKHNGIAPDADDTPDAKVTAGRFSTEAMKFADDGSDTVEMAEGFVKQHEWLTRTTSIKMSLEDYVADRMAKEQAQTA